MIMKNYEFAKFNKLIEFCVSKAIPDGLGGHACQNEFKFHAWAKIAPVRYDHTYQTQKSKTAKHFIFTMRYAREVNNHLYINFEGRTFKINRVINIHEDNKFLELYCQEVDDVNF
jgi:SPP1 family predicted phage head-tail adaptor